jgi:glutamine synthetase
MLELRFVDIHGRLKAMNIPISAETISKATQEPIFSEGVNIDGSSVDGFTSLENSDLHLRPIPETIFELPYTEKPKLAAMCEILQNGQVFGGDTRSRLKYVIERYLEPKGWLLTAGPEPEFMVLKNNQPVDTGQYADVYPNAEAEGMIKRFSQNLTQARLKPKVHHHEVGSGQYEIEIEHNDILRTADTIVTYKALIRALAAKNGLMATFMPKPFAESAGNGMHLHLSLWEDATNLFATDQSQELSKIANQFMAGIIEHAQALTAVVAPTVNSYKRLVPGYEAPVYISWAPLNRSALIRVPMFQNPNTARFEYRCPDPSTNPYLTFSAIIASGIDGIERELELISPIKYNIFLLSSKEREKLGIKSLPSNLFEALTYLEKDKLLCDTLGKHICKNFFQLKKKEWLEYSTQVTDWDWKKYLKV